MRVNRVLPLALVLVAAGTMTFGATPAGAATVDNGYFIAVSPTSQDPGMDVTVTGDGQYYTSPFTGDNCDSTTITATVTYFAAGGAQLTQSTTLGTSDGDGNISGPVTIPAAAAPTSVSGHDAVVQASCSPGSDTFLSQAVDVVVNGSVPPTTTTTTTTTTTSTTTTTPSTTSTTKPSTGTSSTTATTPAPRSSPIAAAPPAVAVTGTPNFTG